MPLCHLFILFYIKSTHTWYYAEICWLYKMRLVILSSYLTAFQFNFLSLTLRSNQRWRDEIQNYSIYFNTSNGMLQSKLNRTFTVSVKLSLLFMSALLKVNVVSNFFNNSVVLMYHDVIYNINFKCPCRIWNLGQSVSGRYQLSPS